MEKNAPAQQVGYNGRNSGDLHGNVVIPGYSKAQGSKEFGPNA